MDARGDEGHQSQEGRFSHQVAKPAELSKACPACALDADSQPEEWRQGDRPVSNRSTAVVGAAGAGNAEVMELAPNAARFRCFAVFLVLWCRAKGARHSERRKGWLGAKFDLDSDSAQVVDGSACRMIVQSSDDFSM